MLGKDQSLQVAGIGYGISARRAPRRRLCSSMDLSNRYHSLFIMRSWVMCEFERNTGMIGGP